MKKLREWFDNKKVNILAVTYALLLIALYYEALHPKMINW